MSDLSTSAHSSLLPEDKAKQSLQSKLFIEYYAGIFLLLIAGFIALSFFILRPRIKQVKELNAKTTAQLQTLVNERSYLVSVEQSVAAAQAISGVTIEAVNKALPYEVNLPSLLQQFGAVAQEHSVQMDSISFVEPLGARHKQSGNREAASARALPVDINLSIRARTYFDVKRFLASLEQSLRLMDVIGLTASGKGSQEVSYQLQLRTYVFTPPSRSDGAARQ